MSETLTGLKRSHYCGTLRAGNIGETVTVCGWVQKQRDKGGLIFIDLRDRTGILQLTFDETTDREVFEKAKSCRSEYVLAVVGTVRERSSKNPEIPTGDVEIAVTELRILNKAVTPAFEIIDNCKTGEDIRLKNRYLDLRRPVLMKNILFKHQVMQATRKYFSDNGFIEIETPMMIKSTPEGARDYIIPSRVHNGSFYALPQSPQLYKQLLMVSGFDKYFQLARCFRDEDLRADRQPEFTQIDVEMSFVDKVEDVLPWEEGFIKFLMKETMGIDIPLPLPRITYNEAMSRYGSDKPDTRYGMEITDISDIAAQTGFGVFTSAIENGGSVRGICLKDAAKTYTRKEIDKLEGQLDAILERMGASKGDVVLFVADKNKVTLPVLGALRQETAKRLGIVPDTFNFLFVVEFPFFEYNDETQGWDAMHHPFTAPLDECIPYLDNSPEKVYAKAYDLVLNGIELSSGSIRITDPELQEKMFEALGFTPEQAQEKFGFLTDAFKYGAPPHGGFGIGLDRLVMLMCKAESLRDVVAFPKVKDASEPMTNAPQPVDDKQLAELGITVVSR